MAISQFYGISPSEPHVRPTPNGKVDVKQRPGGYIVDGRPYPRVSALLGCLPKDWLRQWSVRVMAEHAVKTHAWRYSTQVDALRQLKQVPNTIRDMAAERGSRIHRAIDAALSDCEYDVADDERACVEKTGEFLHSAGFKVRATEVPVWSERDRYAGTFDIWAERGAESWILDWKTSGGIYDSFAVQVAAYMLAEYAAIDGERVPWGSRVITHGGVVHVTPDGCTLYPVVGHAALGDVLRALHVVYDWIQSDNKNGLGKATYSTLPEEDMPIIVSEGEGGSFEPHPEGQFATRCIDVIDWGMVESTFNGRTNKRHRGALRFHCGQLTETNEIAWVDAYFTLSLHEKANLRKFLESWRGKQFTAEELKGFDLESLIGVNAYIQVTHNVTPNKIYANIDSIMKLPKGVDAVPVPEDYVRVCDREPSSNGAAPEPEPAHVGAGDDDLPF